MAGIAARFGSAHQFPLRNTNALATASGRLCLRSSGVDFNTLGATMSFHPVLDLARYALYCAPEPTSAWWRAGCSWLGRNAANGDVCPQPVIPGVSSAHQRQMTATAARYGFHATLKAPFRLSAGATEADLVTLAAAFAAGEASLPLPALAVRPLGNFLALQLPTNSNAIGPVSDLAMRCVERFDLLRTPPSAAELARRSGSVLTARQDALLARWGYPYTEEEFRLHFTLTDDMPTLAPEARQAVRQAAETAFVAPLARHQQINGLTIFRELAPGQPFMVWRRFGFGKTSAAPR